MARHYDPANHAVYEYHDRWLRTVLPTGDSLFTPGQPVWSSESLEQLVEHFIEQPDLTKGKSFLDKLHGQLAGTSAEAMQLMAELHAVHFLIIWNGAISRKVKQRDLEAILSWSSHAVALPADAIEVLGPGLVHPGQWVLTRRDTQLAWLIRFCVTWLANGSPEVLDDPWKFKTFVFGVESPSADGARHALLHMTHPDTFEPIVSNDNKREIVARFSDHVPPEETDVDRQLLAIRAALETTHGEAFDWYRFDFDKEWSQTKQWPALVRLCERFRAWPGFDGAERTWKLDLGAELATIHAGVVAENGVWGPTLKALVQKAEPLAIMTRTRFRDWLSRDARAVRSALLALWSGAGEPHERISRFAAAIPDDAALSGRAEQLNLGSLLLMALGAEDHPPLSILAMGKAMKLAGWTGIAEEENAAEAYRHSQRLLDLLVADAPSLRDRLDAQGALWCLIRYDRPEGFSDAEWQEVLALRGEKAESPPRTNVGTKPGEGGSAGTSPLIDHIAAAATDLHVDREVLDEIGWLLKDKGQVVLYGPPGTGKTFLGLRLARALVEGDESRVRKVQFHPATTYEDFFEGLRPRVTDAGQVTYEVVPGPLVQIADAARNDPDARPHILLIDEINRANLPKVFGELLFLLEYRSEQVNTVHRPDEPFGLSQNLWIIGTMNTADRSIALIDAAMRRRFHFVPFFPHEGAMKGLLRRWLEAGSGNVGVADFLDAANSELQALVGDHLLIGPSHFMGPDLSAAALERIWTYNIFPLIEEQFWGDRAEVDRWRWVAVRERFASTFA